MKHYIFLFLCLTLTTVIKGQGTDVIYNITKDIDLIDYTTTFERPYEKDGTTILVLVIEAPVGIQKVNKRLGISSGGLKMEKAEGIIELRLNDDMTVKSQELTWKKPFGLMADNFNLIQMPEGTDLITEAKVVGNQDNTISTTDYITKVAKLYKELDNSSEDKPQASNSIYLVKSDGTNTENALKQPFTLKDSDLPQKASQILMRLSLGGKVKTVRQTNYILRPDGETGMLLNDRYKVDGSDKTKIEGPLKDRKFLYSDLVVPNRAGNQIYLLSGEKGDTKNQEYTNFTFLALEADGKVAKEHQFKTEAGYVPAEFVLINPQYSNSLAPNFDYVIFILDHAEKDWNSAAGNDMKCLAVYDSEGEFVMKKEFSAFESTLRKSHIMNLSKDKVLVKSLSSQGLQLMTLSKDGVQNIYSIDADHTSFSAFNFESSMDVLHPLYQEKVSNGSVYVDYIQGTVPMDDNPEEKKIVYYGYVVYTTDVDGNVLQAESIGLAKQKHSNRFITLEMKDTEDVISFSILYTYKDDTGTDVNEKRAVTVSKGDLSMEKSEETFKGGEVGLFTMKGVDYGIFQKDGELLIMKP